MGMESEGSLEATWAQLPATAEAKVASMFDASTSFVIGNRELARFWMDRWLLQGCISQLVPFVFNAVQRRLRQRSVLEALEDNQWAWDAVAASTLTFMSQFVRLWTILLEVQLNLSTPDRMVWKWTPNGAYSTSSAYQAFFIGRVHLAGAVELWKASSPPKVKFFFWEAMHGKLWTAERRRRHGQQQNDACALCDQEPERSDHLLISCSFSQEVWMRLLSRSRSRVPTPQRRGFNALVLLAS